MRRLILMRHAKSSWDDENQRDFDRPLNKRGQRDAPRVGAWFTEQGLDVDRCLCSTAVRTRETCDLWQDGSRQSPRVEYIDDLYHAPPEVILECVRDVDENAKTVLVIAHNPGIGMLAAELSRRDRAFPTAAVAVFEIADLKTWKDLSVKSAMREIAFQVPKELDAE